MMRTVLALLWMPLMARAETVALVGGRVITLAGDPIEEGTVVLQGGKIVSVASGKASPAGARAIDCAGKTITPGLVAADTRIGIVEISLETTARDNAVAGEPYEDQNHAAFRVADALNPRSTLVPVARLEGVTSSVTAPEGGLVAGQSAWIDLAAPDRARMLAEPSLAMHANLGGDALGAAGGSRGWALVRLREMLDDARTYAATKAAYDRNQSRALAGSRLDLAALGQVVRGRQPLAVHVDREADILAALDLARDEKIRIVILGGAEAWRVGAALAAAKVPVLIDPTDNLPSSFDSLQSRLDNAARLAQAGVRVGITLRGESHNARTLRQRAGLAAAWGMPHDEALAAASRNVAQAFGMEARYGTLEPGRVANVVVWTGDPLEISTQVAHVFVGGEEMPLVSRQTELRERYRVVPPK
ncbi:MAG: amidohydrolase family protein [Myxococcota bacterium]